MTRALPFGAILFAVILFASGCIDTSIQTTSVGLRLAGTDVATPFEGRNGAIIELTRAELAFGPLYLCSGSQAGALCDEAVAEWRDAAVIDALDGGAGEVGAMNALTLTARSYMYDHGIVSLLTQDEPLVTEAAESLGPASVRVEATVSVDSVAVPIALAVRVQQSADAEQGVPVVRSGESDGFEVPLAEGGATRLTVRFDPRGWLGGADFTDLVERADCAVRPSELTCAGAVEQQCAPDGTVAFSRDCAGIGQACVPGIGCTPRVELDPDSQPGRALRTALEAGPRPTFTFE